MNFRKPARGAAVLLVPVLLAVRPAAAQTAQTGNVFNPNISVIGNALGIAGHNAVDNQPSLQLRESEIGLQAIVDPYARADFFVTFGSQTGDVGIEEGYITFLTVPGDFLVKVGKLKGAFGKVNTEHLHVRLFADTPLVMTNLLGVVDPDAVPDFSRGDRAALPGNLGQPLRGAHPQRRRAALSSQGLPRSFREREPRARRVVDAREQSRGPRLSHGPHGDRREVPVEDAAAGPLQD